MNPLSPTIKALQWPLFLAFFLTLAATGFGQSLLSSWEGMAAPTGWVPPDPHGGPGPLGIVATVNLRISYLTKAGPTLWGPAELSNFWSSVGNSGVGLSDPKVVFDQDSRRFFVVMQENTDSHFWLNVAVSRTSDPHTAGTGDWIFYRFDATEYAAGNSAGGTNYAGDYPGLAVDAQALYVTYHMYAFMPDGKMSGCGCDFTNTVLYVMDKSRLLNGTGTFVPIYFDGFGFQPVTPFGDSPGNVLYLAQIWTTNSIKISAVRDPLGAHTVEGQLVSVLDRGAGPTSFAPQNGSTHLIDTITGRTLGNASLTRGDIWFCATRGQPAGPALAVYYRVHLDGWPFSSSATLSEEGTVGFSGAWNFCPAIGVNQCGDVCMTWTTSSSDLRPMMMYAMRKAGDSAFTAPGIAKVSEAANEDDRWGDFFSVWPDPNDDSFWAVGEWTRSDKSWSTWWVQIGVPARDYWARWDAPFPLFQFGTLDFPFLTVRQAHDAISCGTIHIYRGNYNERLTINKAVTLESYQGAATIGAP